jgi:hypothetical protein
MLRRDRSSEGRLSARAFAAAVVAVVTLAWAGFGYYLTKPTDFHTYRKAAVQSAQSAYNALGTARLTGQAALDDRLTSAYVAVTLRSARTAVAGAAKSFADVSPPDERTRAMRDQLGPLLVAASADLAGIQDATANDDDAALGAAVDAAAKTSQALDAFLEAHT